MEDPAADEARRNRAGGETEESVKESGKDNPVGKLVAGALESRLNAGGATCPSDEILAAYVERTLTRKELEKCETHLTTCATCLRQVAMLVSLEGEEPAPQKVSAPARSVWRWFTPSRLAWAAPALAAVIIAGVWITGDVRQRLQGPRVEIAAKSAVPQAAPPKEDMAAPSAQRTAPAAAREKPPALDRKASMAPLAAPSGGGAQSQQSRGDVAVTGRNYSDLARLHNKPGESGALSVENKLAGINAPAAESEKAAVPPPTVFRDSLSKDDATVQIEARPAAQSAPHVAPPQPVASAIPIQRQQALMSSTQSVAVQAAAAPQSAPAAAPVEPSKAKKEADGMNLGAASESVEVMAEKQGKSRAAFGAATGGALLKGAGSALSNDWKVGRNGKIWHRTLAGTWVNENSGVKENLRDVAFVSPQVGWVVGDHGTILRTTDGGATWLPIDSPTTEDVLTVSAPGEAAATISARDGRTYATTDAGGTWTSAASPQ